MGRLLAALLLTTGCAEGIRLTDGGGRPMDAGPRDDAGRDDGGGPDAARVDGGLPDAGIDAAAACAMAACHADATCMEIPGPPGYRCTCNTGFTGDGRTCTDVDECATGADDCHADATCANETGSFRCTCNMGFTGDGRSCTDVDECTAGTAGCHADATCMNTRGGFTCTCDMGFVGDGFTCMPVTAGPVLVYHDSGDTVADDAVTALGLTPFLTVDGAAFNARYDAGGLSLIIWDAPGTAMPAGTEMRLTAWMAAGNPLIYGWWDLDTSPSMQSALQVTVVGSYDVFRAIHRDTASTVNLFMGRESVPSPLGGTDMAGDNGDALSPTAGGFLAARLDSPSGPGAIAITRSGRVIVHGFLPWDTRMVDGDGDARPDMRELYTNEIAHLLGL